MWVEWCSFSICTKKVFFSLFFSNRRSFLFQPDEISINRHFVKCCILCVHITYPIYIYVTTLLFYLTPCHQRFSPVHFFCSQCTMANVWHITCELTMCKRQESYKKTNARNREKEKERRKAANMHASHYDLKFIWFACIIFFPLDSGYKSMRDSEEWERKNKWSYTHPMKCKVLQFVTLKCDYDDFITRCFFACTWVGGERERENTHHAKHDIMKVSFCRWFQVYSVSHSNRNRKRIKKFTLNFGLSTCML